MSHGKIVAESNPSLDLANQLIAEGLEFNNLITLTGLCKVNYEGRASSQLDYTDCHVVLKPDGTVLIHQKEDRKPVNWQPPGCKIDCIIEEDALIIEATRTSPDELIEISCIDIYNVTSVDMENYDEKELFGTEDQMQDRLMNNPDQIEPGFQAKEAEYPINGWNADIFGYDSQDNPVILELKRRKAGPKAVDQLKRYITAFNDETVRGILVAPSFTESAEAMIEENGFEKLKIQPKTDT